MRRPPSLCLLLLVVLVSSAVGRVAPPPSGSKRPVTDRKRLARLAELTFDRRPSAMLRAWAAQATTSKDDRKPNPLDQEMELFQRRVTFGHWQVVKAYLAAISLEEASTGYQQLLRSLKDGPSANADLLPVPSRSPKGSSRSSKRGGGKMGSGKMGSRLPIFAATSSAERNQFTPDDLMALAAAAPAGLDREALDSLGGIVRNCLEGGTAVEALVRRFQVETAKPGGALTARQAARVLVQAGQVARIDTFLPTIAKARQDSDLEALDLLVIHYLARDDRDRAWSALQAILASKPSPANRVQLNEALKQAVELVPLVKAELGQRWLEESFTREPSRGKAILTTIVNLALQGLQTPPQAPEARLRTLKLQKTAAVALVKSSPAQVKARRDTLTLLARFWLREAEITSQFADSPAARVRAALMGRSRGGPGGGFAPSPTDDDTATNPFPSISAQPQPISTADILRVRPEADWLTLVDDELRPKVGRVLCRLHLKARQEAAAFGLIEELARIDQQQARELANEFLSVWTSNHTPITPIDPEASPFGPGGFSGFGGRGSGSMGKMRSSRGGRFSSPGSPTGSFRGAIPRTRSSQERDLTDLAEWVARLRKLPIGELDQNLLAAAFTACHASGEVYRQGAIEKVFGPIAGLKPRALTGLVEKMRENLAGVWRQPAQQQGKKNQDIEQEVKRGYAVARSTIEAGLKKFPDDWSLVLKRAAVLHDEVDFLHEIHRNSSHARRRHAAVGEFERAAKLYAARVTDLPEKEQSTGVYEQWLSASLGAVDLAQVNEDRLPEMRQAARIRAALLSLPGGLAARHLALFAGHLAANLTVVPPEARFRYLKAGLEIVGDHKAANEARKLFDYYKDLVREIKLETKIDGPPEVGHRRPFGVYVQLRHTRDIERLSGGFVRYLQNQSTAASTSLASFAGRFGRGRRGGPAAPTVDYRDRFQTATTEALKEHFEVLSVTFETDKVRSRAAKEAGWRITPYAYLLLKARGPQVDRLPALRLNMEFQDPVGDVVLPIETAAVLLDARKELGEPRPVRQVEVTQTLDERKASQGKLVLEVKATAQGLVPDLDRVLALEPEGFEIVKIDDPGVSVSKFDPDSERITILSERVWTVTLLARSDQGRLPARFTFGKALAAGTKMHYQRYDDADLVKVDAVVDLAGSDGRQWPVWPWWAGGGVVVLGVTGMLARRRLRRRKAAPRRWELPEPLTPVTTIALLNRIHKDGGLSEAERGEVAGVVRDLERHYFAARVDGNGQVDLAEVAGGWVRRAR